MEIRVWQGDITTLEVDAIVNAANRELARGGGVCGAIFRAAGRELDGACAAIGGCATGDAVATPGFDLPSRWVIHAVGPVWSGGGAGEAAQLASCYRRILEVATDLGATSVAIPAISTGIYGFPADEAAAIAVRTVLAAASEAAPAADVDPGRPASLVSEVVLVAFDDETRRRYEAALTEGGAPRSP